MHTINSMCYIDFANGQFGQFLKQVSIAQCVECLIKISSLSKQIFLFYL